MINGIHHIGMTVARAQAAAEFYEKAGHFKAAPDADFGLELPLGLHAQRPLGASMLRAANTYLRLIERSPAAPPEAARNTRRPVSEAGIVHICMQSPSMDALYGSFQAAGASFHAAPVDLGTGFLYSYARDLEDNVVELEGVPPVWHDPTPWVAHVSFSSADVGRLADFYGNLLGNPAHKSRRLGPAAPMDCVSGLKNTQFKAAWIPAGNMQIEVIQYLEPATVAHTQKRDLGDKGYSYVCFEVTDLPRASSHLLSIGGVQCDESQDLCRENSAYFCDPDGNIILLLAPRASESAHTIAALPEPTIVARFDSAKSKYQLTSKATAK